jgi:hypothetical protein
MSDRDALMKDFVAAALELMKAGLAGLSIEQAVLVARAQAAGADVVLVFAPGAGTIIGALHPPDPAADPVPLFKIVVPFPEGSTN